MRRSLHELGRAPVLFVLFDSARPAPSLRRAVELTARLGGELHVLQVLPASRKRTAPATGGLAEALYCVDGLIRTRAATVSWMRQIIGDEVTSGRLVIRRGRFLEELIVRAIELEVGLVMVPPGIGRYASQMTRLAHAADAPVLVVREGRADSSIIAGVALERAGMPRHVDSWVLAQAAAFAGRLQVPLVAVHHVTPVSPQPHGAIDGASFGSFAVDVVARRTRLLGELSRGLGTSVEQVVRTDQRCAAAIMEEARQRDADCIAVGAHTQSWLKRMRGGCVAEEILKRAVRSVLVLPHATTQ